MSCFDFGGCKSPPFLGLFLLEVFNNIAGSDLTNSILIQQHSLNLKIEQRNFTGVSK